MSGLSSNNDVKASANGENMASHGANHHTDSSSDSDRNCETGQTVVLVVDDSNTVLRSTSDYLTDIGLSVVTATDGFEALAKVVDTKPAMLFVDIMMPRLDGYQTCALIKNNADLRSIPVIMLSSKDGLFDVVRGRVAGADDHIAKPFDAAQITAMVEKHLGVTAKSGDAHTAETSHS